MVIAHPWGLCLAACLSKRWGFFLNLIHKTKAATLKMANESY